MTQRELFKETFSQLHASPDTLSEVMNMAKHENITYMNRARKPAKKIVALVAVIALLVTGVFAAGTVIYKITSADLGEFGAAVSMTLGDESSSEPGKIAFSRESAPEFYEITLEAGWMPEGLFLEDYGKYHFDDGRGGGITPTRWPLNTGKEVFCRVERNVASREDITLGDHEAVFIQRMKNLQSTGVSYDKVIYVAYPEYNYVLEYTVSDNITKEDALKFAESMIVTGKQVPQSVSDLDYMNELYKEARKTNANEPVDKGVAGGKNSDLWVIATEKEMGDIHAIGESYSVLFEYGEKALDVKVTDVTVADDLSPLRNESRISEYFTDMLDENGKLMQNTVNFVVYGDGINTADTVVASVEEDVKLVSAIVELTNNTGEALQDVLYLVNLYHLEQTDEGYGVMQYVRECDVDYDMAVNSNLSNDGSMDYFDVYYLAGGGDNYIHSMAAGETVTIQVAWLVNESELDNMYVHIGTNGSGFAFGEKVMEDGFVDIRQ